jgi:hypothetical protein
MSNRIYRSCQKPIRENPFFDERWRGPDRGLITCWEVGRAKRIDDPELAERAKNGELPVLGWKGGVDRALEKKEKYGPLNYLSPQTRHSPGALCLEVGDFLFTGNHLLSRITPIQFPTSMGGRTGLNILINFNSHSYFSPPLE